MPITYDIRIDFGDNAIQAPHRCRTLEEVSAYLETIPNMIAFQMHGNASVHIERVYRNTQQPLPSFPA